MDANMLFQTAMDQGVWALAFITVGYFIFGFFKSVVEGFKTFQESTLSDLKKYQERTLQKSEEREERLISVIESYSDNFDAIRDTQGKMQEDIKDLKEVIIGK